MARDAACRFREIPGKNAALRGWPSSARWPIVNKMHWLRWGKLPGTHAVRIMLGATLVAGVAAVLAARGGSGPAGEHRASAAGEIL